MRKVMWTIGAAALAMAACVSYQQKLALHADGSGRLEADMWVDDMSGLTAALTAATAAPATATAETAVAAATAERPVSEEMGSAFANVAGLKIVENWALLETTGEGASASKKEHTRLVLDFDNLELLKGHGIFAKQDLAFKTKGGKCTFTQLIRNDRKKEKAEEPSPETEALTRQMFDGYTFSYEVVMPGEVTDTNGTVAADKRTVTWSWPLYDFTEMEEIKMTATSKVK